MRNYREPPIPPYYVAVMVDGCVNHAVNMPDAAGSMQECIAFVAKHEAPRGAELTIVPMDGGPLPSFSFTPAQSPIRLLWQDTVEV